VAHDQKVDVEGEERSDVPGWEIDEHLADVACASREAIDGELLRQTVQPTSPNQDANDARMT
jgi:hypothetical protein